MFVLFKMFSLSGTKENYFCHRIMQNIAGKHIFDNEFSAKNWVFMFLPLCMYFKLHIKIEPYGVQ